MASVDVKTEKDLSRPSTLNPSVYQPSSNMQEITMAYEVLSDPDMRKRYDQFGKDGLEEGSTHNPEVRGRIDINKQMQCTLVRSDVHSVRSWH